MKIDFPVYVLAKDSGELMILDSLYAMQREIEQIDVENGEYAAWDRSGAPLDLKVQEPAWLSIETGGAAPAAQDLRDVLEAYAAAVGCPVEPGTSGSAPFDVAFERIKAHLGQKKRSR